MRCYQATNGSDTRRLPFQCGDDKQSKFSQAFKMNVSTCCLGQGIGESGKASFFNDLTVEIPVETLDMALDVVIGRQELRDITSVGFTASRLEKVAFCRFFVPLAMQQDQVQSGPASC